MNRRKQKLSQSPIPAQIEKFSHEGRGIARLEGKTVFIDGALPEESVTFIYTRKKSDFAEGRLVDVIEPSPQRVEPHCPHYLTCGGCSLQHLEATAQIEVKQSLLLDALSRLGHVQPEHILPPLRSHSWHYRQKARLSARYVIKKQSVLVGFREKNNPRYITDITQCPVLHQRVDAAIVPLRELINGFDEPQCIAQIEVAAGDDEIALIFRNLSPLSTDDEKKLMQFADEKQFRIFLQPGGNESVYLFYPPANSEFLSYRLPNHDICLQFHPTDFTQVNGALNRQMIDHALALLALQPTDKVLDLFCGLGNFSLPIAKYCSKVVGIEGSETMVTRARMNATANQLTHAEFYCANLDDESMAAKLSVYQCNKLLLDPPRTGALAIVNQIAQINPHTIVYVSCNPSTLARDAGILVQQGYQLVTAGVMDMFPHTTHVESIALFVKGR